MPSSARRSSAPVPAPSTSPPTSFRNANFSGLVSNATKYTCTAPSLLRKMSRATSSGLRPVVFSPSVTTRMYLRKTPAWYRSGRAARIASPIAVPPPGRGRPPSRRGNRPGRRPRARPPPRAPTARRCASAWARSLANFGQFRDLVSGTFQALAGGGERGFLVGGELGEPELQALQRVDDQIGDHDAREPLVIRRHDEPRRVLRARLRQHRLVRGHVVAPAGALVQIAGAELPVLRRLAQHLEQPAPRLLLRDVREKLTV